MGATLGATASTVASTVAGAALGVRHGHDDMPPATPGDGQPWANIPWEPQVFAHFAMMTACVWLAVPWGVRLAISRSPYHKWLQGGAVAVMTIAALQARIAFSSGTSAHAVLGWLVLVLLWLQAGLGAGLEWCAALMRASLHANLQAWPRRIHTHLRGLGYALAVVILPLEWFFGLYHTTGIAANETKQMLGHTSMGVFFAMFGILAARTSADSSDPPPHRKLMLIESLCMTIGGTAYFVVDVATMDPLHFNMHLSISFLWVQLGLINMYLRHRRIAYGFGFFAAVLCHVSFINMHAQSNMAISQLHAIHAYACLMGAGFRLWGKLVECGICFIAGGMALLVAQEGMVAVLAHLGIEDMVMFLLSLNVSAFLVGLVLWLMVPHVQNEESKRTHTRARGYCEDASEDDGEMHSETGTGNPDLELGGFSSNRKETAQLMPSGNGKSSGL
eukprot:gnl/Hemi2/16091_TR5340_c0_g1_i2.p1 gnl/Hemi2/16091_TR5340_c0_g1~~gnl/Hemi2/16091_TR5340_c0_g1_i2.p1  ORF type:complete len:447 (-),score=128.77 gnl/Hemi2/16091_TR5340_c0_g1_i2:163-1503(-)